ncbi:MAG: helix-turn-helix domain-containing protein [Bacteroidota bacterium]
MNYTAQHMSTSISMLHSATGTQEHRGIPMRLPISRTQQVIKKPMDMLRIIANTLQMSVENYIERNRTREVVDLRFVSAKLLRHYYPNITYKQIGALYGGQDHTSIMNAIGKANDLLYAGDKSFTQKYHAALNSIEQWINEP